MVDEPVTEIIGLAITVKITVLEQALEVCVYVKVTDPGLMPVTSPALVTVATAGLLLVQVPPVLGVTLAVDPSQTEISPSNAGASGIGLITASILAEELHPLALVTVNV